MPYFIIAIILLLLSTVTGIFKGFSTKKEEKSKRRGSFIFASVAGGLIFISLLSWGGAYAFIEKVVTDVPPQVAEIEVLNAEKYSLRNIIKTNQLA